MSPDAPVFMPSAEGVRQRPNEEKKESEMEMELTPTQVFPPVDEGERSVGVFSPQRLSANPTPIEGSSQRDPRFTLHEVVRRT